MVSIYILNVHSYINGLPAGLQNDVCAQMFSFQTKVSRYP